MGREEGGGGGGEQEGEVVVVGEVGKGCRHTDQPRENFLSENEEEFLQEYVHAGISAGKTTHIFYPVPLFLQVCHGEKLR